MAKSPFKAWSPPGIPAKIATEFERRMRAGRTIYDLTQMATSKFYLVSRNRFKMHCEMHPAWGRLMKRLSRKNTLKKKSLSNGKKLATRHICLNGLHAMKGRNIMIVRHRDRSRNDERRCRACAYKAAIGKPMTAEIRDRLIAALERGDRPRQFCHGHPFEGGPRDPSLIITKVAKFMHQRTIDPEFARICDKYIPASCSVAQTLRHAKDAPAEMKPALIAFARLRHRVKTARRDLGLPPSKRLR